MVKLLKFIRDEDGPTAVEYAVMLGLIILACLGSIALVGSQTSSSLGDSSSEIQKSFDHVK